MRKHPYECDSCNCMISKVESEKLLGMCVRCYTDCCEQSMFEQFNPILNDMAWHYVKLMREYDILGWDNLDGLEDRSDEDLSKILCGNYVHKHGEKA